MCLLTKPVPMAPVSLGPKHGPQTFIQCATPQFHPSEHVGKVNSLCSFFVCVCNCVICVIFYTYWCRLQVSLALFQYFMISNFHLVCIDISSGIYCKYVIYIQRKTLYLVYVSSKLFFMLKNYIIDL